MAIFILSLGWQHSAFFVHLLVSLFKVEKCSHPSHKHPGDLSRLSYVKCICLSQWFFIVFILYFFVCFDTFWAGFTLLINPKKLMLGPPQGAEDAPGHAFLLQGKWSFHSPRTILKGSAYGDQTQALVGDPVGNPQSKQGTGMSFISCRASPVCSAGLHWVSAHL